MRKPECELCGDEEECLVCQMADSVEKFERCMPSIEQQEIDNVIQDKIYARIKRNRERL